MQKRWYARVGYVIGGIVGLLLFVGLWIYCIATYGFLSGVGLGWLPAAIVAVIIGLLLRFLWGPLLFLVAIGAGWLARPDLVPTFDTLGILFSVLGVWVVWGVIQQRRERRQQESDDFPGTARPRRRAKIRCHGWSAQMAAAGVLRMMLSIACRRSWRLWGRGRTRPGNRKGRTGRNHNSAVASGGHT